MKIAIASGKGGTGKTSLATALTKVLSGSVTLLDCDVEEPNCHIFFNHKNKEDEGIMGERNNITRLVPDVDETKCVGCGACSALCQFNAIVSLGGTKALVFPELCHSCGGCVAVCPQEAITEKPRAIGTLTKTLIQSENKKELITGRLNIGEALAPPVIKEVLRDLPKHIDYIIIDAPPGTSCPFVAAIKKTDFVIFVTEATAFGLHDLQLAIETVREMKIPFGVVVNRIIDENNIITDFCLNENIPILLQINESRTIASLYSAGYTMDQADQNISTQLQQIIPDIQAMVKDHS